MEHSNVVVGRGRGGGGNTTYLWIINNVKRYVEKHVSFRCSMTTAPEILTQTYYTTVHQTKMKLLVWFPCVRFCMIV